jgi:hypothetical protein
VDILIMVQLLVVALLGWRGANRGVSISLWVGGIGALLVLFRFHVASLLALSF